MVVTRLEHGWWLVVGLVAGACGCNNDVACDPSVGDATVRVGTFEVELVAAARDTAAYTSVGGLVHDGPTPETLVWETAASAGDCTLLTPRVPFCSTPCGGSAACVEDETCEPYPAKQDVGTVWVSGLSHGGSSAAIELTSSESNYQIPSGVTLAYPPFAEGDAIDLSSDGSAFACGFTMSARGIPPLVVTTTTLALADGTALDLAWTPPADPAAATVAIKLDISHHGGTKGKIVCETADDGALTIAATLIDDLLALGAAGYPSIILSRDLTSSAVVSAGRVELLITAQVELLVDVPGVQSCNDSSQCTPPQVCRDDLTCG